MKNLIFLVGILLSGCSTWPKEGQGGWEEKYTVRDIKKEEINKDIIYEIENEYEHLTMKLDWLKLRGIKRCMPARLYQIELELNKVKREMAGELYFEAKSNMEVVYHKLNQLQRHFEKIISKTQCISKSDFKNENILIKIKELLNSDNQFAFNKFEITPKYKKKLSKAAELIKMVNDIEILLVGHTDNIGFEHSNYELAYKRAENVKKWLVLYGVKEKKLSTLTQGSLVPYSKEKDSESKRHSDRRVNAYILNNKEHKEKNRIKKLSEWTNGLNEEAK